MIDPGRGAASSPRPALRELSMKPGSIIAGIDLGTSSVKVLGLFADTHETAFLTRSGYEENTPEGWWRAICGALSQVEEPLRGQIAAIGLSSQVGTWVVWAEKSGDPGDELFSSDAVISWRDAAGKEELDEVLSRFSPETFLSEIGMPHPKLISFPIPRILHAARTFGQLRKICEPKDLLCEKLTGNYVSDPWSWRGLYHPEKRTYSRLFVQDVLQVPEAALPRIIEPAGLAGSLTPQAAAETGLPAGIPVYAGLNDFYSGLAGMGILGSGTLFDITGTSEHLGITEDVLHPEENVVSGPYLRGYIRYGVTASGGASFLYAHRELQDLYTLDISHVDVRRAPVFLPYVNGERAPIFDPATSGAFLGILPETSREQMAYAVLEGIVFSLYHIYDTLGKPPAGRIITGGGLADDPRLALLKASVFGLPLLRLIEQESSALGAVMCASIGCGIFPDMEAAAAALCRTEKMADPDPALTPLLRERYAVYRGLYPPLKESFHALHDLQRGPAI